MPSFTYTNSGGFTITLTVLSDNGCATISAGDNFVIVYPLPQVTCTGDPTETDIENPTISFSGGVDGLTYSWDFGDVQSSSEQNPSHDYDTIGTYQVILTAIDANSCVNTCQLQIIINPYYDIVVPNAFTPNPNGSNGGIYDPTTYDNDVFFPSTEYIDQFHMMIFNRWGELVFETFDIKIGWDGYYRGQLAQQDMYAWRIKVIFIDGVSIERLVEVTLIR